MVHGSVIEERILALGGDCGLVLRLLYLHHTIGVGLIFIFYFQGIC